MFSSESQIVISVPIHTKDNRGKGRLEITYSVQVVFELVAQSDQLVFE